jgi:hypothetical protein
LAEESLGDVSARFILQPGEQAKASRQTLTMYLIRMVSHMRLQCLCPGQPPPPALPRLCGH